AHILETFGLEKHDDEPVFTRTLKISPASSSLQMRVAPDTVSVSLRGNAGAVSKSGGFHVLKVPPSTPLLLKLFISTTVQDTLNAFAAKSDGPEDLDYMTRGGPARYA